MTFDPENLSLVSKHTTSQTWSYKSCRRTSISVGLCQSGANISNFELSFHSANIDIIQTLNCPFTQLILILYKLWTWVTKYWLILQWPTISYFFNKAHIWPNVFSHIWQHIEYIIPLICKHLICDFVVCLASWCVSISQASQVKKCSWWLTIQLEKQTNYFLPLSAIQLLLLHTHMTNLANLNGCTFPTFHVYQSHVSS